MVNEVMSHPKGLYLLFITEMSERFSYYGMRALLTLYMVSALFTKEGAAEVYGTFTSLVYLTPLIGGYIADRYWGNRRSIVTGGCLMAVGQFLMFLSACFVNQSITEDGGMINSNVDNSLSVMLMMCGLGMLILGNGFFKPNIVTMVGDLYEQNDKRKDSAFTIFYMGVNVGALFAPLVCGLFEGDILNPGRFKWGFLIACIVISISMILFLLLKNHFLVTPEGRQIGLAPAEMPQTYQDKNQPLTKNDYIHMAVIVIIAVFVIFFWAAYEQAGVSLTYFADKQTDKTFFGWEMPTSWFQTFPAFFCVALAPVMNWFWPKLGKYEPHAVNKLAVGLLMLSLSYFVISFGVKDIAPGMRVSILWLTSLYFIQEIGELSISPIGLSLVNKLSPRRFVSLMMGIWYLSTAVSNYVAGQLAMLYPDGNSGPKHLFGYEISNLHEFFFVFVIMSGIAAIILFAISPLLKKMMSDIEQ